METSPLTFVVISRPWWRGTINGTTVYIRGQMGDDTAGFTATEAETLFELVVIPNFADLMEERIRRLENCFASTNYGERQICICRVGPQLKVFPVEPHVQVIV